MHWLMQLLGLIITLVIIVFDFPYYGGYGWSHFLKLYAGFCPAEKLYAGFSFFQIQILTSSITHVLLCYTVNAHDYFLDNSIIMKHNSTTLSHFFKTLCTGLIYPQKSWLWVLKLFVCWLLPIFSCMLNCMVKITIMVNADFQQKIY